MLRGFLSSVTSSAPVSKVTTPWSSRPPSAMSSRKPSVSEVPTFEPPVVDLSGFSPAERAQLEAVLNRVEMETKTTQLQDVAKAISPEKTEGVDTLTGLTVEEQRQIEAVLKRAEAELSGKPPAQPKSDPIGHKFDLSEFNDAERQRLEEMIKLADVATEAAVKAIPLSSATTDKTSAYSSRKCSTVSDASLAPSLAEIDLSGLTPEEKQQIEAVMRKLEPGTSQSFEPQSLVESGFEPRSDLSDSTFEPQTESQHANDNFESQRHHNDDNMDISSEFVNFTGEFCRITTPSPTEPAQFDDFPEVPSRQKSLDDVGRYLPASPLPSRPQSPFLRADSRYDASAILAEVDLTQFSEEERAHIEEVLSRAASNSSISPGPSASDTKVMPETSPGKTYLASPDYPSYPPTPGATFTPAYGEIFISEEPELPDQTEISSKRSTLSSSSSRDRWETANMESSAELKAKRRPKWAERHVSVDEVEMGSYTEDLAAELPIKSDLEPLEEVKMLPLSPLIEARIEPPSTDPPGKPSASGQPSGSQICKALENLGIDTSGITLDEQFHIYSVMLRAGTISPISIELDTVERREGTSQPDIMRNNQEINQVEFDTQPQSHLDYFDDSNHLELDQIDAQDVPDYEETMADANLEEIYEDYGDNEAPEYDSQLAYQRDGNLDEYDLPHETEERTEVDFNERQFESDANYRPIDEDLPYETETIEVKPEYSEEEYPFDNEYQPESETSAIEQTRPSPIHGAELAAPQDYFEPSPTQEFHDPEPVEYTAETHQPQIDYFDDGDFLVDQPELETFPPEEDNYEAYDRYESQPDLIESNEPNMDTDEVTYDSYEAQAGLIEPNEPNLDTNEIPYDSYDAQDQLESYEPNLTTNEVTYDQYEPQRDLTPEVAYDSYEPQIEGIHYDDHFETTEDADEVHEPESPKSSATGGADNEDNLSDTEFFGESTEDNQLEEEKMEEIYDVEDISKPENSVQRIKSKRDRNRTAAITPDILREKPENPDVQEISPIQSAQKPELILAQKEVEKPKEASMFSGFLSNKPRKSGGFGLGGFGSALSNLGTKAIGAAHTVSNFAESQLDPTAELSHKPESHHHKPTIAPMQLLNESKPSESEFPGLTPEEIAHIQRINEMAMADVGVAPPSVSKHLEIIPVVKPDEISVTKTSELPPPQQLIPDELTEAELAQIRAKAEAAGVEFELPSNWQVKTPIEPSAMMEEMTKRTEIVQTPSKSPESSSFPMATPRSPEPHSVPLSMPKSPNLISTFGSLKSSTESITSKTFGFSGFGFGSKLGFTSSNKTSDKPKSPYRSPSPVSPMVTELSSGGLSAQEIAQIEEITKRAEMEMSGHLLAEKQPEVKPEINQQLLAPQQTAAPGLTPEELAHIQRIAEMAEAESSGSFSHPKPKTAEIQNYSHKSPQQNDAETQPMETKLPHLQQVETEVFPIPTKMASVPASSSLYSGLTPEEIEQIERIARMAEMEGFEPPPIVPQFKEHKVTVIEQKIELESPKLTIEEIAHMQMIAHRAEIEDLSPVQPQYSEMIPESLSSISDYREGSEESHYQEGQTYITDTSPITSDMYSNKPLSLSVDTTEASGKILVSPRRSNPFLFDLEAAEQPASTLPTVEFDEDFHVRSSYPSYQLTGPPNNSPCSNTISSGAEMRLEDETTYEYASDELLQSDNSALSDKNPFLTATDSQHQFQLLSPTTGELPVESDEDLSDVELTDKQKEMLSSYREMMTEVHKLSPSPEYRFMPEFPEFDEIDQFAVPTATVVSEPVQLAQVQRARPVEMPQVRQKPIEPTKQQKTPTTPQSSGMFGSLTNMFASPVKTPASQAPSSSPFGFSLGKLSKLGDTVKSQVKSVTSATSSTASSRRSSVSESLPDFQPDLSGLTAEEAAHIQAVMANFSHEEISISPVPPLSTVVQSVAQPVELSEAEQLHIEAVMRKAAEEAERPAVAAIPSRPTEPNVEPQAVKRMSTSHTSFGSDISRPETDDTGYQSQFDSGGSPEDRGFSPIEIHPEIPETIAEEHHNIDSHYAYGQTEEESWYRQQQQNQQETNDYGYSQAYPDYQQGSTESSWTSGSQSAVTTMAQPQIISFPDMPDLDLSQFCEEERAHIIGMLCKAAEFEKNFAPPPIVLTAPTEPQSNLSRTVTHSSAVKGGMIIPEIREIQPTPEDDRKNVADEFDQRLRETQEFDLTSNTSSDYASEENLATQKAIDKQPQHYDSSDFSSDFIEEEDEERRIREIEAEFAIYAEHVLNRSYLNQDICPLCHVTNLQLRPDGTTVTGQTCGECGLTACSKCGRVVSTIKREKRQWICAMCHSRRELAALTEQRLQKRESGPRQLDNETHRSDSSLASSEPISSSRQISYQTEAPGMTQEQTGFAFQQPTETHYKTEPQLPSSEFQAATFSPTPADSYRSDQYSGYYDSSYQSQLDSSLRHSPGFSASLTEQSGLPDEAYMYGPNDFYQSVVESREIRLASVPELTVESPSPTSPNSDAILTPKRQVKGRRIKDVPKVSEDSDDSEPDEPDSDEDYPDEIIEVPSLPPGSFTDDFSSAKEELSTAKGDDIIHEITKAFATGLDYNDAQFDQFVSATRAARRTDKTDAVETDIFTDIQSLCSSDSQTAVGSTSKSPSKTATPTPPPIPARSVTPPGTVGSITLPPPIPRATSKTADKTSAVETYDNQPATSEFLHFDSSSYTPVTLASSDGYLGTISTDNTSRSGTAVTYASVVEPHMTDSTSSATSASGYASDKEFLSYEESEEDESSSSYRDESTTDKRHTQQQQQDDDIDVQQAAKYYNNSQYLMHTPGPVYTIPEDDEEETEAQYYSDSSKGGSSHPYLDVASSEEDGSDVDEDWKFRVSTQEQFASGGNDIADEFVLAAGFSLTGLTSSAMLSIANVSHTFTTTQSRPATTTRTSAAATTAAAGVTFAQQRPDTTKVVSSLQYYQQRTTDKPVELQSKRVGGAAEPLRITTGAVMTSQPQSAQNSPPYSPKDPMFSHFDEDVIREQHEHRHESPSPTKKQQFRHFPHPSSANNADKLTIATSNATQQPNNMQIYSDIRISPPDKTITREQLYGRGEANVPSGNLQGRPIPTSPGEDAGNILELCKSLPTSLQYGSTSSQPHLQQQQQFGSTPSQQQSYQYISYSQSPGHFDQQQFSSKAAQQSIEQQKLQHHAHVSQSQGQFEQPQQQQQYSYASTSAQSTSDTSKIIYAKSVKPKVKASDSQTNSSQQQLTAVPTVKKSKSKSHSDWSPISDLSPILDVSPSTEQAEAEVNPEEFAKIDGTTITAVVQANGQIIPIGKSQLLKQHQQDQFVSKLKRSPAMILHGSNGNGSGAEVDTSKDSLYAKLTEENQRLRAAVASVAAAAAATNPFLTGPNPFLTDPTTSQLTEDDYGLAMGRRRLPSVPQSQTPYQLGSEDNLSYGQQPLQSQLSRTSPQRSRSDAAVNRRDVNQTFEHCNGVSATFSGLKPGQNLFDYTAERKSLTSLSNGSLPTGYIAKKDFSGSGGKTLVNTPTDIYQTVTSATLARGGKISSTLARVLLKQELRDALAVRRQQLEASEIEANQREYVVKQMVQSGRKYPKFRYGEEGPSVIRCELPLELIAGAKVVPSVTTVSIGTQKGARKLPSAKETTKTTSVTASANNFLAPPTPSKRRQLPEVKSEPTSTNMTVLGRYDYTTSSQRPNATLSKTRSTRDSATQTLTTKPSIAPISYSFAPKLTEELRYNSVDSGEFEIERRPQRSSRSTTGGKAAPIDLFSMKSVGTGTSDLGLMGEPEILRGRKRSPKSKKLSSYLSDEDDTESRELRKLRLREEINRRRQKLSSIGDLSDLSRLEDYQSASVTASSAGTSLPYGNLPQYGSLPRHLESSLLRQAVNSYPENLRDLQQQQQQMQSRYKQAGYNPIQSGFATIGTNGLGLSDKFRPQYRSADLSGLTTDTSYRPSGQLGYQNLGNMSALSRSLPYINGRQPQLFPPNEFESYRGPQLPSQMQSAYSTSGLSGQNILPTQFGQHQQQPTRQPYNQTVPYGRQPQQSNASDSGLLSHYANYLNNHFDFGTTMGPVRPYVEDYGTVGTHHPRDFIDPNFSLYGGLDITQRGQLRSQPDPILAEYDSLYTSRYRTPSYGRSPPQSYGTQGHFGASNALPTATTQNSWASARNPYDMGVKTGYNRSLSEPNDYNNPTVDRGYNTANSYMSAARSRIANDPSRYYSQSSILAPPNNNFAFDQSYQLQQQQPYTGYKLGLNQISNGYGSRPYSGFGQMGQFPNQTIVDPLRNLSAYQCDLEMQNNLSRSRSGYAASYDTRSYGQKSGYPGSNRPYDSLPRLTQTRQGGRGPTDINDLFRTNGFQQTNSHKKHLGINNTSKQSDFRDRTGQPNPTSTNPMGTTELHNNRNVKRILLSKDKNMKGSGLGMKVIGGKILPNTDGVLGAYIAKIYPGGVVDTLGEVKEGDQILEWNGVSLTGCSYEEVQQIIANSQGEIEALVKCDSNLNSDLSKRDSFDRGYESGGTENNANMFGASEASMNRLSVDRPEETLPDGTASPCFSTTPRSGSPYAQFTNDFYCPGELKIRITFDESSSTLFATVYSGRNIRAPYRTGYPNPFVKIYLLPGRRLENKRRTKYILNTSTPQWNQTVVYKDVSISLLREKFFEFTVWDYERFEENKFIGELIISLQDSDIINGPPRWYTFNSRAAVQQYGYAPQLQSDFFQNSLVYPEQQGLSSGDFPVITESSSSLSSTSNAVGIISPLPMDQPNEIQIVDKIGQFWYRTDYGKLSLMANMTEQEFLQSKCGETDMQVFFDPSKSTNKATVVIKILQCRNLPSGLNTKKQAYFIKLYLFQRCKRICKLKTKTCTGSNNPKFDTILKHEVNSLDNLLLQVTVWKYRWPFKTSSAVGEAFLHVPISYDNISGSTGSYDLFMPRWNAKVHRNWV